MSNALVLRRSALESFSCPFRYRQIYVDGVPDDSDEAIRGRAFHAAARRYIHALWQTRQREDLQLAEQAFAEGMVEERTPAHLLPEVGDLFWQRWAPDFELDLDAYLSAEEQQVDSLGYTWTPDLLYAYDDLLEIPDFKTYWIGFSDAQARHELQGRFYAASARRLYPGFAKYRIRFDFVRWGFSASATFDTADLDQVDAELAITRQQIERAHAENAWPAVPGQHCGFCRLECPVVNDARLAPVRISSAEDAQRIAGQLLVLQQAATARRKALEAWCAGEGPVTIGGREWAHRPSAVTTFPIAAVMQILIDQGVTPTFSVSKSALRTYLTTKRFAHVRPDLEALATITHGTKFTAKKVGDVTDDELIEGEA
jgi:hypothetical protein